MSIFTQNTPKPIIVLINFIVLVIFLPLLLYGVYQISTLYSRASGTTANIAVDSTVSIGKIDNSFYHAFSQGGEEQTDMISTILPETTALRPKLIRIDHIYDNYDVVSGSRENLVFDFSRLDAAVDSILRTGAKPVLSLSYMPRVIAIDGKIVNPPIRWEQWTEIIRTTIEHYSGKNGKNISSMYYEVWNEPDLKQFGGWSLTNYLTLYHYAAIGANTSQNVNQFFFGGPATTGLYKTWIIALIKSGDRLDFLSWHSYLKNPLQFTADHNALLSWLTDYPRLFLIPKLITEFGFDGSKNILYSTQYAAAYTAAVIRQMIVAHPDYIFSFELKDGPDQTDGSGWGLMAHENFDKTKKPRYYVYNYLNQIQGDILQLTGEGTWVTGYAAKNNDTIRLLLVNFDQQNTNHLESVPVKITGLRLGRYLSKLTYLFHGSCAIDNPPSGKPAIQMESTDGSLLNTICLPTQNMAIWEIVDTNN